MNLVEFKDDTGKTRFINPLKVDQVVSVAKSETQTEIIMGNNYQIVEMNVRNVAEKISQGLQITPQENDFFKGPLGEMWTPKNSTEAGRRQHKKNPNGTFCNCYAPKRSGWGCTERDEADGLRCFSRVGCKYKSADWNNEKLPVTPPDPPPKRVVKEGVSVGNNSNPSYKW